MSHGSTEVYLVDGVRTPQGEYGGALASVRPDDLAGLVVGEALRRSGAPADAVEEVVLGAANQAGEDNRDVARMAVLLAGVLRRLEIDEEIVNPARQAGARGRTSRPRHPVRGRRPGRRDAGGVGVSELASTPVDTAPPGMRPTSAGEEDA